MLVVMVFDDEARTGAGMKMLRVLHGEGMITLYACAAIACQPRGAGTVLLEPTTKAEAAAAPAVGAALGALVSFLEGPLSAAMKAVPTGLIGAMRDLAGAGLTVSVLEQVSRELRPGGAAILAEIDEAQPVALDALAVVQGGRLFRHRLAGDMIEHRLMYDIRMLRQELGQLGKHQHGLDLTEPTNALQRSRAAELGCAVRHARSLAASLRREAAAKAGLVLRQASLFESEPCRALERRAAVVKAGLEKRAERLERAADVSARPRPARRTTRSKGAS